jgi:hypothetical protein
MSLKIITVAGTVLISTLSMNVLAEEANYSLEYSPTSPIKEVPLDNAQLKLEVYKSDNPAGFQEVTTDANRNFKLDGSYNLEVVSIKGEEKHNAQCSGSGTTTDSKIMISCTPKNNAGKASKAEEVED